MKLLFKLDDDSEELKDILGFVDKDLSISHLKADLITATNDVIEIIGDDVYEKAVEYYNETDLDIKKEYEDFLFALRNPIAVNAYSLMAASKDIAHTNNGRKARQDENEKLPFEWMLDRNNAAMEKRYYRALDDLIKFLDKQPLISVLKPLWVNSEAFKASHNLFIRTVTDFDKFFPIKSRLLMIKLSPGIFDCEQYEIRPRVGKAKFDELKLKLKGDIEIDDQKDIELLRLIRQACVFYSLSWSMMRLSVQLFPEGVLQHYTSDRGTTKAPKPSLNIEPEAARLAFAEDAKKALKEIEALMAPEPTIDETITIIPEQNFGDKYFST